MNTDTILFKIRSRRQEKNYSQQYIASLLQMNQANYNKIENGKVELSVTVLIKIAKVLDINFHDFLNGNITNSIVKTQT